VTKDENRGVGNFSIAPLFFLLNFFLDELDEFGGGHRFLFFSPQFTRFFKMFPLILLPLKQGEHFFLAKIWVLGYE